MSYQLPRDAGEARRLEIQSELLQEATETVLGALDVGDAAACLDLGCGTGDVMLAIAARAPQARVVGLDLDVRPARARLARAGGAFDRARFALEEGDLFEVTPEGAPFDLVFSRYVLHHMADPVAALARMWALTREGGTLAVLDIDQRGTTTYPVWAPYEQVEAWIRALYVKLGLDNHIGHKLPSYFERAGIGRPDGTKVTGVIRPIAELAEFLPLLLDMVREKLVAHGVATETEIAAVTGELATAGQQSAYCYRPTAVGVWKRKQKMRP